MRSSLQAKIKHYQANHLIRERLVVTARTQQQLQIAQENYLNFASNDYLGLSQHPLVKEAFIAGVQQYGLGSTAASVVSGYYGVHQALEEYLAHFLGNEAAILFGAGYMANLAAITTLCARNDVVLSDKYCHASLLDGIQLTRSKHYRFQHHDMTQLAGYLDRVCVPSTIVSETVFSMSGDMAPVQQLVQLAKQSHSQLIMDDAHAFGVLGEQGRGILGLENITSNDITCLITPFGKALGSMGAVISGNKALIECVAQFANSYRYTTALPPAVAYATLQACKLLANETWHRDHLHDLIRYFNQQAQQYGLNLISFDNTPIRSLLIGDNALTLKLQRQLLQENILAACIRPPTVPVGTARLRICLNAQHQTADIDLLLQKLAFYLAMDAPNV